ncbi:MAG: GtrA family protein [Actinomycetota bacterium]|nr:GtrA family protein [Actinomycetota bacterium]
MAMTLPGGLVDILKSPGGQKLLRYSVASVVSVAVSLVCLVFFNGVLNLTAVPSSILATAIATIPNYFMNRMWAWGKDGRSHLWREVVPFWSLALIGLAFSTLCVKWVEVVAKHHHFSHLVRTGTVAVVYVGAFGVLWVAKFIIFNKVLFVHHIEDLPEALDGRSGVPL